jgi:sugar phosphate isomerase/epimerase
MTMKAGVSTASLYPDLQEDCLFALASRGVKYLEVFLNTHSEFYSPYLDRIMEIKREYDIVVTSVHPYTCGMETMMLFTPYVRRIDDFLEYQKLYFDYMNKLGAKYFILHGGKLPDRLPETEIFDRFGLLQDLAESFGVTVLQENVVRCSSRDLSRLVRMKEYLGDKAAFVLDVKQAKRSGYDPVEHVQALGDSIKHIHYSDSGKKGDCLLFGEGDYDNETFFDALYNVGYSGAVLLELYREETPDFADRLAENSKLLQSFFDKRYNILT